jgi:putative oxidoreductase
MDNRSFVQRIEPLIGRLLIGGVYLINGIGLIGAFGLVAELMTAKGVPASTPLLVVTIAAWLAGGLCIVVGYRMRAAALLLAAISIPVTLYIHGPWGADSSAFQNELNHFLKNLAMIGGLLYVASSQPGAFSLEARLRRPGKVSASASA